MGVSLYLMLTYTGNQKVVGSNPNKKMIQEWSTLNKTDGGT